MAEQGGVSRARIGAADEGPDRGRSPGDPRREVAGLALVAAAAVLWGLIGPVARVAFREGIEPLELAFWRALLAGLLFAGVAAVHGRVRLRSSDVPGLVGFAVTAVALFYASYLFAVEHAGAALASILLYTAPAWVAMASFLWLGERLTARSVVAVALTLLGVAGVALGGGGDATFSVRGVAWGLVAGLSYALYYLAGKRYFGRYGTVTVMAYALPIGALTLLPLVDFQSKTGTAWAVIAFVAVFPTFVAYLIYGAGLLRVAATRAATVAAIEPVVAALAAFVFWGERFTTGGYLGAGLVLAAVFLTASTPARGRRGGG